MHASVGDYAITDSPKARPNKVFRAREPYLSLTRRALRFIDLSGEEQDSMASLTLLDDLGQGYVLSTTGTPEVKVELFEGKFLPISAFRIASFPRVRDADVFVWVPSAMEYAKQEARDSIYKQEDAKFVQLLDSALEAWDGGAEHIFQFNKFHRLSKFDRERAVGHISEHEITAFAYLVHPRDRAYLNIDWSNITILESTYVPRGRAYLLCNPDYLGALVSYYGLREVDNPLPEQFHQGAVCDELISMVVVNPRGIVRFDWV